jgi:hypothetical protein
MDLWFMNGNATVKKVRDGTPLRHLSDSRPVRLAYQVTSQHYFSLITNQSPAISQQYFSLKINQHQPSTTS